MAAFLVKENIPCYSPIAHTHPVALYGGIDPYSHEIWLKADKPFMDAAAGLVVVKMEGWGSSYGIHQEVNAFAAAGKPIVYLDWESTPAVNEGVLEEAIRITSGDRHNNYGHPRADFRRTAKIWSAILGVEVTPT